MGGKSSKPPRPPPLPTCPTAYKLVLCERGSHKQLMFSRVEALRSGQPNVRLSLTSHPDFTIVARSPESGPMKVKRESWMCVELGIAKDDNGRSGLQVQFDSNGFITSSHTGKASSKRNSDHNNAHIVHASSPIIKCGCGSSKEQQQQELQIPSMVFDISWAKYEEGITVNLVGSPFSNDRSRLKEGGRTWVINQEDGTISASKAPNLVLGADMPDVTLVDENSKNALVFDRVAELISGRSTEVPLTVSSHPGFAVCPQSKPQRIEEWKLSYQRLGLGGDARHAMIVRKEGDFIVSATPSSSNFVLDIPFDCRVEGCEGHALAVLHYDHGKNKKRWNKGRRFRINKNNTISPIASPDLVLGLRPGMEILPSINDAEPVCHIAEEFVDDL